MKPVDDRWQQIDALFSAALDEEPAQRESFLARACGADESLREAVADLLRASTEAGSFLDRPILTVPTELEPTHLWRALVDAGETSPDDAVADGDREPLRDPLGLSGRSVTRFRVGDVLGHGGMGVVYRAEDSLLGRSLALKFLLPQLSLDALARRRFLREARAAAALDHPHICAIYDVGETEEGHLFLAMPCYPGETLRERLLRVGALPVEEALTLARQVLSGLDAAHAAGVLHRDLKPGNLMLTPDGTLRILDFGLARVQNLSLTDSSVRHGTIAYMSPERIRGERVDARADLWSLGVVLYELLTGQLPFGAGHELATVHRILHEEPPPSVLRPEVPAGLEEIVLGLLKKDPEQRYASAAEVLDLLPQPESRPAAGTAQPQAPASPQLAKARPHNLPLQATPLVGREKEVLAVRSWLRRSEVRLLTLTGPGGIGKTRLALEAAAGTIADFADGVHFVNLAPLTDPFLIPSALAQALGVREADDRSLADTLLDSLRDRRTLLLCDNFEHLVPGAPLIGRILAAAPGVKVLVTSRVSLRLSGEQEYAVPPLSLPDPADPPSAEQLAEYEAVRLFIERAQQVRPDFRLTAGNAAVVADICRRLDGLPLAIELAAARTRILPPQTMLTRLESRLKLLTGGARDLPRRHQTLRDAIGWSYELLDAREQALFRRLAVFSGGRTLEAIEAVCKPEGDPAFGPGRVAEQDVLEGVSSLVDKNLLRLEEVAGEPRFVMLETIHEYAAEKLEQSGETDHLRRRHAEYFRALAEEAEPRLSGPEQGRWLGRLAAEHDNIRGALGWLADRDPESAACLAGALTRFWYRSGNFREGRQWLEKVLSAAHLPSAVRAKALLGAGVLANFQNDAAAQPLLEESLALYRELEDLPGIASALNGLGLISQMQGNAAAATKFYEDTLALYRQLDDRRGASMVLGNLGCLLHAKRDHARAGALYRESLALARELGNAAQVGMILHNLGHLAYDQNDPAHAGALLRESLACSRTAGDLRIVVFDVALLALVEGALGSPELAARLAGAAESHFAALGTQMNSSQRDDYDRHLSAVQARVNATAWKRWWQEGTGMTLDQTITEALGKDAPAPHG